MKHAEIRPSQFITSYGVGAIIDTPLGLAMITSLEFSEELIDRRNKTIKEPFIISPPGVNRLSNILKGNVDTNLRIGLYKLATNAELGKTEGVPSYDVKLFPSWAICNKTENHPEKQSYLYRRFQKSASGELESYCPVCKSQSNSKDEIFRLVKICTDGHIDDINFPYLICGPEGCKTDYYLWIEKGLSNNNIFIKCPICNKQKTLGQIENYPGICSGRHPHKETKGHGIRKKDCDKDVSLMKVTATNIFRPLVYTSISLPYESNMFYSTVLQEPIISMIKTSLKERNNCDFNSIYNCMSPMAKGNVKYREMFDVLEKIKNNHLINEANEIIERIKKLYENSTSTASNDYELRKEEFDTFIQRKTSINLGKTLSYGKDISLKLGKFTIKVRQILNLEVILCQKGFTRNSIKQITGNLYDPPKLVDTGLDLGNPEEKWYVAVKNRGEGLFFWMEDPIQFETINNTNDIEKPIKLFNEIKDGKPPKILTKAESKWFKMIGNMSFFKDSTLSKTKIWWHTFSHLLIQALSLNSGYSTASIRERLYYDEEKRIGGVLLYCHSPGSEGTLGGLVTQIDFMDEIMKRVQEKAEQCSFDPICEETKFDVGRVNGSACFSCLYLSETSCEFGNVGLDRVLFRDSL